MTEMERGHRLGVEVMLSAPRRAGRAPRGPPVRRRSSRRARRRCGRRAARARAAVHDRGAGRPDFVGASPGDGARLPFPRSHRRAVRTIRVDVHARPVGGGGGRGRAAEGMDVSRPLPGPGRRHRSRPSRARRAIVHRRPPSTAVRKMWSSHRTGDEWPGGTGTFQSAASGAEGDGRPALLADAGSVRPAELRPRSSPVRPGRRRTERAGTGRPPRGKPTVVGPRDHDPRGRTGRRSTRGSQNRAPWSALPPRPRHKMAEGRGVGPVPV